MLDFIMVVWLFLTNIIAQSYVYTHLALKSDQLGGDK